MALDPFLLQNILEQISPASIPGATPPFSGASGAPMIPANAVPTPAAQPPDILQDILAGRFNPVAEPEKLTTGQKVAGGLADFVNNYLALKYGRPTPQSSLAQMRGAKEEQASKKTQGNLARVRAQIEQRERKSQEAKEAGETARAERRLEIDEAENKRKAREIADGKIADQVELAAALKAYEDVIGPVPHLNLTDPGDVAKARGLVMRAKLDEEQANKLALRETGPERDEETATDRKAARALKEEFTSDIEEIEDDLGSLKDFPDPEAIRKKFYRRVRRRFKGQDAADLIEQFELVNGPAIDKEMERRGAQREAGQRQAMTPQVPLAGAVPFGGIQSMPNLLQILGEQIGYGKR